MKIYTRTGDDGSTGLLGHRRVLKSDPRIECFGTLDEANAAIGIAVAQLERPEQAQLVRDGTALSDLIERLQRVQGELFVLGSHMAVQDGAPAPASLPPMDAAMIARLEHEIDTTEARLDPLASFILPGGMPEAAQLHLARAICRRGERLAVALQQTQSVPRHGVVYLNRLADWLFVQARLVNHLARVNDIPWHPRK